MNSSLLFPVGEEIVATGAEVKETITSLELVEQINAFRKLEKGDESTELRHDTLRSIIKDEFEEELLSQNILEKSVPSNGGRPSMVFELSFNQAKQVLMRESKFVRKAVIDYIERLENHIKQNTPPMSKLQMIAQMAGEMARIEQEQYQQKLQLDKQQQVLDNLVEIQQENKKELEAIKLSTDNVPTEDLRVTVRRLVNSYSVSTGLRHSEVWSKVYSDLYYIYKVNINATKKLNKKETLLDVADRKGHLQKIYTIISELVKKVK